MLEEDIDDTHLCIKCSTTIVGIENYVQHRKNSCSSKTNRDIVHVDHPYDGTYDFSETSAYHHHDHHKSEEVEKPGKSLSESYDLPYDLGADVFFSSLELQSSSKRTLRNVNGTTNNNGISGGGGGGKHSSTTSSRILTRKATAALLAHHEQEDEWIEQTSSTPNNNSHNLMISGNKKCEPPSSVFTFNHDSPEPETEDEDDVDDEDYETTSPSVPANHTGGKWKPTDNNGGNLRQHHDHHTLLRNSPSSAWDDRHHNWDIITDTVDEKTGKIHEIQDDFDHDFNPPPGHTKGKWVPGTKIVKLDYKEEVEIERIYTRQYWCNTCNRKLASKILYERHLKSNLHLKRSEPEQQLERAAVQMITLPERIKKPSKYLNSSMYVTSSIKSDISEKKSKTTPTSEKSSEKRKRRKYYTKCETCKIRLPKSSLGKHLISHYHYRRMIQSPIKSYDMILENMDRIVKQAPYQCQSCQFYTNTENDFLWHWNTSNHRDITEGPGRFWCSFCKFECEDNNQMRRHLLSIEHKEIVLTINRSVPIIIGKKIIIECYKCKQIFRYNFELRKHAEHCTAEPTGTASNNYQSKFNCNLCNIICKSRLSLQKHQLLKHKRKNFYCSICNKNFETALKSKKHRSSIEHKICSSSKKHKILIRKCKICNETLQDILKLKEHMKLKHPECKSSCPHCGKTFALPQEVGRHIRDMQCSQSKELHLSGLLESDEITSIASTPCSTTPSSSLNTTALSTTTTSNISSSSSMTNPESTPLYLSTMSIASSKTVLSTTNSLFLTVPSTCSTILNPPLLSTVNSPLFLTISPTPLTRQDIAHDTVISSPIVVEHITNNEKLYSSTNDNNESNDIPKGTQTENDKMLSCSKCDYRTTMKSELLYHEIFHKQEHLNLNKKLKISCPLCEKKFRKHSLRCHLRQHTNEKNFICNYCQMSFGRKHNLKTHIINRHETDKKQQKQQKIKKDSNDKIQAKYQCDTCGKSFKKRYSLQQHIGIHGERDKRFSCPKELCIFIGRDASDLKIHLSIHSTEKNFKCTYDGCDYMGKTMRLLKKHSIKHESNKILSCPECNFTAKLSGHIKRHMLTHTGEKPYKCPHCSYSCNNLENLRKHVLLTTLHTGKYLYECEYCDTEEKFKTNFQREYRAHLVITHRIEVEKLKELINILHNDAFSR